MKFERLQTGKVLISSIQVVIKTVVKEVLMLADQDKVATEFSHSTDAAGEIICIFYYRLNNRSPEKQDDEKTDGKRNNTTN